jgi:N-dimethylarginine dimethylaminohydrolase
LGQSGAGRKIVSVPSVAKPASGWSLDNHTGVLTDVLLGRPEHFRWVALNAISAVTFANMERAGHRFDRERALTQHRGLVDAFHAGGVRCHFLAADPGLTSSVYARDSSFMTPWGPVVASIQTPPRVRDHALVAEFFTRADVPIWKWVTAGYFEGGDFSIVEPGVAMLGYSGTRSTKAGAEQVAGWLTEHGWEVLTIPMPPQFVHLDSSFVMLAEKLALVCEDALQPFVLDFLRAHGVSWLTISYSECMSLGGNLVSLGAGRILSMAAGAGVNERLAAEGLEVTAVEYDQFALAGGGVHCSCQDLRRGPAA